MRKTRRKKHRILLAIIIFEKTIQRENSREWREKLKEEEDVKTKRKTQRERR